MHIPKNPTIIESIISLIPVIVGALIAIGGSLLVFNRQSRKEKKMRKLLTCNDLMKQVHMITDLIKLLLKSNLEFMYHEWLFRKAINSAFNEKMMFVYKDRFGSLEIQLYEEFGNLYNSISEFQLLFGFDERLEERNNEIKNQAINYAVDYRIITSQAELNTRHEEHRSNIDTNIKENLFRPYIEIENIVKAKRDQLKF